MFLFRQHADRLRDPDGHLVELSQGVPNSGEA